MSAKCGKYIYDPNNEFGNGRFGHVFIAENEDEVKEGEKKYYVLKIHEEIITRTVPECHVPVTDRNGAGHHCRFSV